MAKRFFDGTGRDPIDREAALMLSEPWNEKKSTFRHGVLTTILPREMKRPPENTTNYTGFKRGHIEVIGYIGSKQRGTSHGRKKNGTKKPGSGGRIHFWQFKCDCGRYQVTKHPRLARKDTRDKNPSCTICNEERRQILSIWGCL